MNRKLTLNDVGQKCSCYLHGIKINNARIQFGEKENGGGKSYFICQNQVQGQRTCNKLGYMYSYSLGPDPSMGWIRTSELEIEDANCID